MQGIHFQPPFSVTAAQRQLKPLSILLVGFIFFTVILSGCASVSPSKTSAASADGKLSVVPSVVDFKSVVVGQKNSQAVNITNTSKDSISLQELRVSGPGFALSPLKTPVVLPSGQSMRLSVVFSPSGTSNASGALVISSSDLKTSVQIPLSGSGTKTAPALTASPSSINFGSQTVKSSASQTVTLKNSGNIALSIKSIALASTAFSISGLSQGVSLSPNQTLQFQVWFRPPTVGSSSSTITLATSSLPTPLTLGVSGSATNSTVTSPQGHSVTLAWQPSTSSVAGYHVYRSETSGGPYTRISSSIITTPSFKDTTVQAGGHYFYVVTAVEADGSESANSNEVSAEIPNT
jgi:hypothetical protein